MQSIASVTSSGVSAGLIDRICAATPAACGVAMDVPEIVLVASSEPDQAALISRPGAKMSMQGP